MSAGGAVSVRSLTELGGAALVLGDYWHPDRDERTGLGMLLHRAKDLADPAAVRQLAERFAGLASILPDAPDGSPRLVAPVPSNPASACGDTRLSLAECLADSLASAGAGEFRPGLVVKGNATPRLRHVDPERRAEVAASARYRASELAAGRHIVVVDDVILTGTTLTAVTACLQEAGTASVTVAAAARTRLR